MSQSGGEKPYKAYDGFAKELFSQELAVVGEVDSKAIRVSPEQYIDVRFVRTREGRTRFALLGELAGEGSLWEPFSTLPTQQKLRDNIEKHLAYNRDTRRQRNEKPWEAPHHRLWLIVPFLHEPSHPMEAQAYLKPSLEDLCFRSDEERGSGFYTLGAGWNVGLVVVEELPLTDDTLGLRLLGRGSTLEGAIRRLKERVHSAQDTRDIQTLELLIRWGIYGEIYRVDDPWLLEILMHLSPEQAFEAARRKIIEEAKPSIIEEAKPSIIEEAKPSIIEEGVEQGLKPLRHLYERRLGRALTLEEHKVLLQRFGTLGPERVSDVLFDLEPEALAAWLARHDAV